MRIFKFSLFPKTITYWNKLSLECLLSTAQLNVSNLLYAQFFS